MAGERALRRNPPFTTATVRYRIANRRNAGSDVGWIRVRRTVTGGCLVSSVSVLPRSGVSATSYEGTPENPTEAAVLDAVAAYKEADCDDVVASSGGSSMDLAKVVALAVTKDGCAYSNPPPCTADDYV